MEKKKPTYLLKDVKKLIKNNCWHPTMAAREGASRLNLNQYDIKKVVLELEPTDFYKSMDCNYNHKIWQDVYYKKITGNGKTLTLYIKLQITEGGTHTVVISFKQNN